MSSTSGKPLRALIYNRVSADPTGRRISTAAQDAENRAFCQQQGWEVVDAVTDDDRSASRFAKRAREGHERVRQALDGQLYGRIDVLVMWESSRGERKLEGYVDLRAMLERNHVLLAYKGRVYDMAEGDDRFTTGLDALLDEREAERARERTLRSHRASIERGSPRGVIPYGYMREYDPGTGHMLGQVPDPTAAPVVQEIVRRFLTGHTLWAIAQDLNRRGVPGPRAHRLRALGREDGPGPLWSAASLRKILSKQSLMGVRSHNGQAVGEATWPAIVDPAEWAAVQRLFADPSRVPPRGVAPKYLLSGIAECGVCSGKLRAFMNRDPGAVIRTRPTYRCSGVGGGAPAAHVSRAREPLERFVVRPLLRRLQRPDFFALVQPDGTPDDLTGAQAEVADLEARLAEYEESAVAGGISAAAFARIEAKLLAQLEQARARATPSSLPPVVRELAGVGAVQVWERWSGEPDGLMKQRQVVRALMRIVVHRSSTRGSRTFDASTVELSWRSAAGGA